MRIEHIHRRIDQQRSYINEIAEAFIKLISVGKSNISKNRLEIRLQAVKDAWNTFKVNHQAITHATSMVSTNEQQKIKQRSYFSEDQYTLTHDNYLETMEKIQDLLDAIGEQRGIPVNNSLQSPMPSTTSTLSHQTVQYIARLPRIDVPKFNGNLDEWLSWKGLFTSLVLTNVSLSPAEKLQHLKVSLVGPASHILKNTPVTIENFEPALEAVIAYYENERRLVHSAIQTLFNTKPMSRESATEMEKLYTAFEQAFRTLEALKRPINQCDDFLVFLVVQKLDPDSVKAWELSQGSSRKPATWSQMREFLTTRIGSIQAYENAQPSKALKQWTYRPLQNSARAHQSSTAFDDGQTNYETKCPSCSANHFLSYCGQFGKLTTKQRYEFVMRRKLCFNCLRPHRLIHCQSTRRCTKCGQRHHTLIHQQNTSKPKTVAVLNGKKSTEHDVTKQVNHMNTDRQSSMKSTVLLATAQIKIVGNHGEVVIVRALLDQGSEISLITENLVQRLRLKRIPSQLSIIGVGATATSKTKGQVDIEIQPYFLSDIKFFLTAHILTKLTTWLPVNQSQKITWSHLKNIQLADPYYTKPGPIELLIGADLYGQLLEGSIIKGPINAPIAQLTSLGWVISGPTLQSTGNTMRIHHCISERSLNKLLERFWQLEELPENNRHTLSPLDQECEDHFVSTHHRDETGRYVVRLPLKHSKSLLGDSSNIATSTLQSLQRRFANNPELHSAYATFLEEYEQLGHMERVPNTEKDPDVIFYLPHHGVIKESSITTKLRVVFNGSCRMMNGKNINDILHTGPKLQMDVIDVIIWVRQFKYIFSCDVEKMYRQISIHKDDWDLQRIMWIDNHHQVQKFRLTTVTYGLACAPYLALRAITQLIQDEGHKYPFASETLAKGRYVDDIFGGANTIEEAQIIAEQVNMMCLAGGFPLRKWRSNVTEVLSRIPNEYKTLSTPVSIKDDIVQALGVSWNPTLDIIQFHLKQTTTAPTKRGVLSHIAQFFDPLGLLAPIFINFKIFMQELWTIKVGWDEHLPDLQLTRWNRFLQLLNGLSSIQIPRWLGFEPGTELQIHGFCDASQLAMAGSVYLRTKSSSGIITNLICAKTKVAPLKRMTIPRLELSAAVILAKLVKHCREVLNLNDVPCYLWTDSSIVYTWLNSHPSRWKDFIHNRVCMIQDTVPHAYWRHVPGTTNPSDCATRGLSAEDLTVHTIWWQGPVWLREHPDTWPQSSSSSTSSNEELELRQTIPHIVAHVRQPPIWELISRYSSLTRLLRITALCTKIVRLLMKKPCNYLRSEITPNELHDALMYWVHAIQRCAFHTELQVLLEGRELQKTSNLLRLIPFVDGLGFLRVGGRLRHSNLPPSSKHPYILPKESPLSTLIIRDAHDKTLHGSTQETLNYIRDQFWILGGRTPVRSFIQSCVKCARHRRQKMHQLMGQLPASRVTPSSPFHHTGVDYAGPFTLKSWKGRGAKTYKAWISLFVCQATSAIHLEIVTDYTTDAFLAAFRRFVSRRGIPSTMRSDCGTNFKGANQELKTFFNQQSCELKRLASIIAQDGTTWIFNPPASPHFGGKWEAGVKSMKFHLKRVVGDTLLTFEEMVTITTQIEGILNSRPICPLTDDPDDLNVLTPGHFLIGRPLHAIPEPQLSDVPINHLSRWQNLSQMVQSFWTKWSKEYLQRHQTIYKWTQATPIKIGTMVLIMDERYPPSKWPLGRIISTHPGKDSIVRVVTIKTGSTTITRPVVKLCILPVLPMDSNNSNLGDSKAAGNVQNVSRYQLTVNVNP